jgi:predicted nuclease of predicted toxin-antitoxin system
VRVLLDEQIPRRLARQLIGHDVRTVQQERWAGFKNGELLERAANEGFDVLLTGDQNLQYQQNLAGARVGVVVVAASSNRLEDLSPLVPRALEAIASSRPGLLVRVTA